MNTIDNFAGITLNIKRKELVSSVNSLEGSLNVLEDPTSEYAEYHQYVINAFNKAGLALTYSSGTGGRHTFIPRDQKTFYTSEYAAAKSIISMIYPFWDYDSYGYLIMLGLKTI